MTRFRREHAEITEGIRRGIAECATATDPEAVQALRDHSVRLFADLVRHRKRGLDLVYEAYHVDIGGESYDPAPPRSRAASWPVRASREKWRRAMSWLAASRAGSGWSRKALSGVGSSAGNQRKPKAASSAATG